VRVPAIRSIPRAATDWVNAKCPLDQQDGAGPAGLAMTVEARRRIRGTQRDNPGDWGNRIRVEVEYVTFESPDRPGFPISPTFNMIVSEIDPQWAMSCRRRCFVISMFYLATPGMPWIS
jgi:hypothetical protein